MVISSFSARRLPAALPAALPAVQGRRRLPARKFQTFLGGILGAALLTLGSLAPALAADPFRTNNPKPVGEKTSQAFEAMFKSNDYAAATELLNQAQTTEANEPLAYTLLAVLAYQNKDWAAIPSYAQKTRQAATALKTSQPLRSHVYLAMADFLEGAYALSDGGDGPIRGMSKAFGKLKGIYGSLKQARNLDPNDPELNLVQGFMDMMTSVYLPLSDSKAAIAKLELVRSESPDAAYLADWALATGYRTMKQYDKGLEAANRGLKAQPNHAEMHYLKGQLLATQGNAAAAQADFKAALQASDTMPKSLVGQIFYEACKNQRKLDSLPRNCDADRDKIRDGEGNWGPAPADLPKL